MATARKDQCAEQQHERQIKSGKDRGVGFREGSEERSAAGDEPDFVAVPDRADRIQEDSPVFVFLGEEVDGTDSEVEAVEDCVAREENPTRMEPDELEIHGDELNA